ncbi:MAG TPA: PQQ-binding-like beta-propeller repeat protein, partial [Bryobacteraceae bacterium]|nr:PQQ-binding-like beta-propeller repeat protein [Bryobacteraceae bacterium]
MRKLLFIAAETAVLCSALCFAQRQSGTANGEWRFYGGDAHSTKYSPLDQINAENVKNLKIAWRWESQNFGPRADFNWEVTPLMANGVLYFTAGTRRDVVAADAKTGETLWVYRIDEGERGSKAVRVVNRAVSYWSGGQGDDRILFITLGYQLIELNAKTGLPVPGFGQNGIVELLDGLDRQNIKPGVIGATSPPMIIGDVAVVGAALGTAASGMAPPSMNNVPGYVRGYDVHTGKRIWTFHTVAQPGEFGNDTWKDGSWKYTGNTAVWAPMAADPELGYIYLPVETPTGDYYGGHRPGNDLFDESLVCLDAKTGKRVWHFQFVHHGIWDWDLPASPVLLDIDVNGKKIKAVAQVTKQAFMFVFDRVTGQPVWPIVERPVPQSDVPGEQTSATQPFPTRPAPYDRQGFTVDDLADFTPEVKAAALKIASEFKLGPIYTPPIVYDSGGKKGVLMLPNATGGANWTGAAGDPETGMIYVPSVTNPYVYALVHDPSRSDMRYIGRPVAAGRPMGLPIVKPPYGRITAIDLNT